MLAEARSVVIVAPDCSKMAAGPPENCSPCDTSGLKLGEEMRLFIKAEDLQIEQGGNGQILGIVERKVYTGGGTLYYIDVGDSFLKVRSLYEVQEGSQVTVKVIGHV